MVPFFMDDKDDVKITIFFLEVTILVLILSQATPPVESPPNGIFIGTGYGYYTVYT